MISSIWLHICAELFYFRVYNKVYKEERMYAMYDITSR